MQVVKIDGNLFLGNLNDENTAVTDAMLLGTGEITDVMSKSAISDYYRALNLETLIPITIGKNSAVMSRDFNPDEAQLIIAADFAMEMSERKAIKEVENAYFDRLFRGK